MFIAILTYKKLLSEVDRLLAVHREYLVKHYAAGDINRELFSDVPPRPEYSVTDFGKTLLPHVEALINRGCDGFGTIMLNRCKQE